VTSRFVAALFAILAGVIACGAAVASFRDGAPQAQSRPAATSIAGVPVPRATPPQTAPAGAAQPWLLNNPAPLVVPQARANPVPVADKFASRTKSIDERATLRAFEGAPPVVPHPILDLNVQTCRACHATGLKAGGKTARMASHTYLVNCTQCHVEKPPDTPDASAPQNAFVGLRPGGYGGTRAWAGAPPVMPHSVFMRTNCVSCHGEHGYDGWRPDHLSRTNCMQCHVPAAEFEQLSPTFGTPDVPEAP
jgi:nitrate reductase (cytochrome), electron transfer subunit